MKRDPASGASLRGHCRIARWLTISACAGKGSNPFSRSLRSRELAPSGLGPFRGLGLLRQPRVPSCASRPWARAAANPFSRAKGLARGHVPRPAASHVTRC
jgi:hypothetical protein